MQQVMHLFFTQKEVSNENKNNYETKSIDIQTKMLTYNYKTKQK